MIDGLTDEIFTVFGEGMGLLKEFGSRKIDFEFWVEGEEVGLVLAILAGHKSTGGTELRGIGRVEMVGSDVLVKCFTGKFRMGEFEEGFGEKALGGFGKVELFLGNMRI